MQKQVCTILFVYQAKNDTYVIILSQKLNMPLKYRVRNRLTFEVLLGAVSS